MRDVNGFGDRTVRTVVRLDVGVKANERNQTMGVGMRMGVGLRVLQGSQDSALQAMGWP